MVEDQKRLILYLTKHFCADLVVPSKAVAVSDTGDQSNCPGQGGRQTRQDRLWETPWFQQKSQSFWKTAMPTTLHQ